MWYVIPKDELYHHGILGQKWGVRRFQNPDGTLTAEGRKRYEKYSQKHLRKSYIRPYNKASEKMNNSLQKINEKYKDDSFEDGYSSKRGQQYIKEISETWKKLYLDELKKEFYDEYANLGEEWIINNAFMMNMYDELI